MTTIFGKPESFYEERGAGNTAREIARQPALWRALADSMTARKTEIEAFMEKTLSVPGLRIVLTGAGSSAFIGESAKHLLARECGLRVESVHTTDFVSSPDTNYFDVPTLLVSYARSGESPESVATVRFAQKKISQLYQVILVCDGESSLAKAGKESENTLVLVMPEGSCDRGFAMTSSVSCMMLATWCLFRFRQMDACAAYVKTLADLTEKQMDFFASKAEALAQEAYRRIIYIGSGALCGLAREGAVKSMELTDGYVHAGYDAATGFRHGPKTVINDETLSVHILSLNAYTQRYDLDLLREMNAEKQQNKTAVVCARGTESAVTGTDCVIAYDLPSSAFEESDINAYLMGLVFIQLLSLQKSLALGYTSDTPCKRGTVNRVVQGIVIYDI